jgi:hypothetical protein
MVEPPCGVSAEAAAGSAKAIAVAISSGALLSHMTCFSPEISALYP